MDAAKWFVSECGIDPHAGETSAVVRWMFAALVCFAVIVGVNLAA